MLVLSRKKSQRIDICGGIDAAGVTVTIVEIRGDKVRIGIEAPIDVPINRREVQERIDGKVAVSVATA